MNNVEVNLNGKNISSNNNPEVNYQELNNYNSNQEGDNSDELHDGKLQEIEEAHNLWLAGKKEEKDKQQETEAAHNIDAARSFKLNQDE